MGNNQTESKELRYIQNNEMTNSEEYKTCTILETDDSPRTNFGKKNKFNISSPIVASKNLMKSGTKLKSSIKVNKIEEKENMKSCYLSTEGHIQKQILNIMTSSKQRVIKNNFNRIQIDPRQFIVIKTNSILDDYIIESEIGKGGYGIVYRGTDKLQKQSRAIKKIFKDKMSIDLKLSLINQFQILKQLDHPNVIKLYDIYETQHQYYVVTELCEGGDMLKLLNANHLTPEIVREVMTQLLSAIKYLHSFNILHRDLKLQNMVIVKKLKNGKLDKIQVKLIDFGISLDLNKVSDKQTNQVLGTLVYMSPEALRGQLGLYLDMWSCGIICYLLLTKKMPFNFNSQQELESKILKGHYNHKPLQSFDPQIKLLISQLLQKDMKKRVTVDKSLKNVWLRKKIKKHMNQSQFVQIAYNISAHDISNNLVSMIESFLVHKKINQGERQRLAVLFQQIDEDKSGIIDEKEFMNLYFQHSQNYNVEEVKEMLKIVDKNQSGKIDFNEFISVMYSRRKLFQRKNLEEAFDFFNKKHSGQLSREQLRKVLAGIENEELELIFQQLDSNKDDKISKDEFINYLISKDGDKE